MADAQAHSAAPQTAPAQRSGRCPESATPPLFARLIIVIILRTVSKHVLEDKRYPGVAEQAENVKKRLRQPPIVVF